MLDRGANNGEGYLEIVSKGKSQVRNGVWLGRQCGDGGIVPLGHSTIT